MAKKPMKAKQIFQEANLVLLGLLMLLPGLLKLFDMGVSNVAGGLMANHPLFSWAPMFWAIVLVILEIATGVAILTRWKLKYVAYVPAIILAVALLTVTIDWTNLASVSWSSVVLHLIAIANYLVLAQKN